MTTRYQRLDPIWRAFAYRREPLQGGKRRDEFQRLWRGAALAALLTAPAMAYAAGAPQPQEAPPPQEAPAQAESAPAAAPKEPAPPRGMGMVRYSRPVFHNGHLVLWHGAWRGGGGVRMQSGEAAPAKPAAPTGASAAAAAKSRDFLILADGADASASRMAGEFAAAVQGDDIHVKAIAGKTSTPALEKIVSSDSADLAIIPMDRLLDKGAGRPARPHALSCAARKRTDRLDHVTIDRRHQPVGRPQGECRCCRQRDRGDRGDGIFPAQHRADNDERAASRRPRASGAWPNRRDIRRRRERIQGARRFWQGRSVPYCPDTLFPALQAALLLRCG